jgi:hypothetical protein
MVGQRDLAPHPPVGGRQSLWGSAPFRRHPGFRRRRHTTPTAKGFRSISPTWWSAADNHAAYLSRMTLQATLSRDSGKFIKSNLIPSFFFVSGAAFHSVIHTHTGTTQSFLSINRTTTFLSFNASSCDTVSLFKRYTATRRYEPLSTCHQHPSCSQHVVPVRILLHLPPLRPGLHAQTASRSRGLLQCLPPKTLSQTIPIPQLVHLSSLSLRLEIPESRSFQHFARL